MSLESSWLAGEYDGVVVAKSGPGGAAARIQLFGDLGPKMIDLLARPERILGYFPQTGEGVDCALPDQASPHPLLFIGASLVEHFSEWTATRILGVREEPDGCWVNLRPAVRGMTTQAFRDRSGRLTKSRLWWIYGLGWEEVWDGPDDLQVHASGLSIRVRILERAGAASVKPGLLELALPPEVRIVRGSRK
jgi:hypothetical protein